MAAQSKAPQRPRGLDALYGRYKCAIHNSHLWVTCLSCNFDVFEWSSDHPFGVTLLDDAIKRHEGTWHKSDD